MSALGVLLIEERPAHAEHLHALLTDFTPEGFSVDIKLAATIDEGVALREPAGVDAIVLGVHRCSSSCLDSMQRLVDALPRVPLLVVTDGADSAFEEALLERGAEAELPRETLTGVLLWRALRHALVRKSSELRLRNAADRYALAVEGAQLGIWDLDTQRDELWCSVRARHLLGLHATAELGLREFLRAFSPEDQIRFRTALVEHLAGNSPKIDIELETRGRPAAPWVAIRGKAMPDAGDPIDRHARRIAGSISDISTRRAVEAQLRHDALHDALTGLPNRLLLLDRLEVALKRRHRDVEARFAVLFFDLDRFKTVNDSLGHAIGDQLLVAVSQRLLGVIRPGDTVARMGGDEFALLIENLSHEAEAIQVAERLWKLISAPMEVDGHALRTSASIGIVVDSPNYRHPEELLRDADLAMYRAKGNADLHYAIFDEAMHAKMVRQHTLETDLWRALERHEFRVVYQPILALDSGRVTGFEALLRWEHPVRGVLMPATFMKLIDETGLCQPVGWFALERVLADLAVWAHAPHAKDVASVCVNISSRFFLQERLVNRLSELLAKYRTPPGSLRLELTEDTLLTHDPVARDRLTVLRDMGVLLYVDDFGTGYSSFAYLRQFRYDGLKIDRSFVAEIGLKPETDAIIESVVHLGRTLKMEVVAEGVENAAQADRLRALGCPTAQGFWFSEPLSATDAVAFLARDLARGEGEVDKGPRLVQRESGAA